MGSYWNVASQSDLVGPWVLLAACGACLEYRRPPSEQYVPLLRLEPSAPDGPS